MAENSPHHWFQFRLRTLLIAVAVLAVLAWCGRNLNWIRERHAWLDANREDLDLKYDPPTPAPFPLRLFGEKGIAMIGILGSLSEDVHVEIQRLFPEAEVDCAGIDYRLLRARRIGDPDVPPAPGPSR